MSDRSQRSSLAPVITSSEFPAYARLLPIRTMMKNPEKSGYSPRRVQRPQDKIDTNCLISDKP